MADATSAVLRVPRGYEKAPDAIGQKKSVVRDIVWTSDAANATAGKTVNAADVGLVHIYGVDYLGDVGGLYSGTDVIGQLNVSFTDDDTVVVTGLTSAGAALDLDAADIAAARVRFIGD